MPLVELENIRLYYEEQGSGPALVLAHGHACGVRSWDPQLRVLTDHYRVIVYDARGHGLSDAPREASAYSQEHMVDDLCGLLDHLGLATVTLVGLSMGGNVVLNFALAHPDRVSALILADTGAGSDDTVRMVARSLHGADLLESGGLEAYVDWAMSHPAFARFASRGPEEERFIRSCLMTNRAHGIALSTRGVQAKRTSIYALEPQLRQLLVPVLLVVGEQDQACVPVHAFMARTIPDAVHHVIPGAGHLTNLEAPDAFNRLVAEFLDAQVARFSPTAAANA
jgi:pimeloyl-ACP methyl ester carboxylesterase